MAALGNIAHDFHNRIPAMQVKVLDLVDTDNEFSERFCFEFLNSSSTLGDEENSGKAMEKG